MEEEIYIGSQFRVLQSTIWEETERGPLSLGNRSRQWSCSCFGGSKQEE